MYPLAAAAAPCSSRGNRHPARRESPTRIAPAPDRDGRTWPAAGRCWPPSARWCASYMGSAGRCGRYRRRWPRMGTSLAVAGPTLRLRCRRCCEGIEGPGLISQTCRSLGCLSLTLSGAWMRLELFEAASAASACTRGCESTRGRLRTSIAHAVLAAMNKSLAQSNKSSKKRSAQ